MVFDETLRQYTLYVREQPQSKNLCREANRLPNRGLGRSHGAHPYLL